MRKRAILEFGPFREEIPGGPGSRGLVQEGEDVLPGTPLLEMETFRGAPFFLSLRQGLGLQRWDPEEARPWVLKEAGDPVEKGEVVAQRTVGLLKSARQVFSPVKGTVEWVSWQRGEMLIREDPVHAQPVVVVNAARQLDIWPGTLRGHLVVREGAEVKAGAILAAVPSRLGVQVVYAPVDGRVEKIDDRTGMIYLLRPVEAARRLSPFYGKVEAVEGDRVILRVEGARVWGVFGEGAPVGGPLSLAKEPGPHLAGTLWIYPGPLTEDLYQKARRFGAKGVVAGTALHPLGHDLPYMITEGFGEGAMLEELAAFLKELEGVEGHLNPRTQVQAGGLRPHLTLSGPGAPKEGRAIRGEASRGEAGEAVILRRGAFGGKRGRVLGAAGDVAFPGGLRLPAAEVELITGERVLAALDNLEVIRYEAGG